MTLRAKLALADMAAETRPLCLHVYRIGGIWGDDKIVRADDRKTTRYYLKNTRLAASWQFALYSGGPDGVSICHVKSPYIGPPMMATDPGPITITLTANQQTVHVHRGSGFCMSDGTYWFKGLDEREYRWQPGTRLWSNRMECLDSHDQVVATYRTTVFAMTKDGELRIHQTVRSMVDLFVATCLAMRTPDH